MILLVEPSRVEFFTAHLTESISGFKENLNYIVNEGKTLKCHQHFETTFM